MSEYIVVKEGAEGLYEEKKSRFIGMTFKVDNEEQVAAILEAVRKKYWDARHNCHAFVIGENNEITRCSDDGEPSGTAGKPILEVITGAGVHNCLVVVTRYFGGTLLGTGGLVRAYTKAAKDSLSNSRLARLVQGEEYSIVTDYNSIGKIQYIVPQFNAKITDSVYTDKVEVFVEVVKEDSKALLNQITEGTGGRALITKNSDKFIESEYSFD
jgi:uncharacterized YigZ family protein